MASCNFGPSQLVLALKIENRSGFLLIFWFRYSSTTSLPPHLAKKTLSNPSTFAAITGFSSEHVFQVVSDVVFSSVSELSEYRFSSNDFECPCHRQMRHKQPALTQCIVGHGKPRRKPPGEEAGIGAGHYRLVLRGNAAAMCSRAMCNAQSRARLRVQKRRLLMSPRMSPPSGRCITTRLAALRVASAMRLEMIAGVGDHRHRPATTLRNTTVGASHPRFAALPKPPLSARLL